MKRRSADTVRAPEGSSSSSSSKKAEGSSGGGEEDDRLEFRLTRFESPETGELLMAATELFKKQLPKMPAAYIMRHVLDFPHHRTLVVIDRDVQRRAQESSSTSSTSSSSTGATTPTALAKAAVVGGICFRTFARNGFIEIVFCAVLTTCQGRGVGRRMMNRLKDIMKGEDILCFLTCAANEAVPYFRNMGFSDQITTPHERYAGYIEEYSRVTLMECILDRRIASYSAFAPVLRRQGDELFAAIEGKTHRAVKHAPLPPATHYPLALAQVPGLSREGAEALQRAVPDQARVRDDMRALLRRVRAHRYAEPFLVPVNVKVVTDYLSVIKNPIDLQTIGDKIDRGLYITMNMMCADLQLMLDNCKTYNDEGSYFYNAAVALEHDFAAELKDFQDP